MFWKKRPPQFDPEKHIGQLLLTLPKCTRRVIAIDGNLDQTFTCKYIRLGRKSPELVGGLHHQGIHVRSSCSSNGGCFQNVARNRTPIRR